MDPFSEENKEEEYIIAISNAQVENSLFDFENTLAVPFECPPGKKWLIALHSISLSNRLEPPEQGEIDLGDLKRHLDKLYNKKPLSEEDYETFLKTAVDEADELDYEAIGAKHLKELYKALQTGSKIIKSRRNKLDIRQLKSKYEPGDEKYILKAKKDLKRANLWYFQIRNVCTKLNQVYKKKWHKKKSHLYSPIFVELDQLLPTNICVEKRVGSFFLNHKYGATHYQPLHHSFFPLQNLYLDKLNIQIKNHKNEILSGLPSNPTIVEFILKPEDMTAKYEHRTCYVTNKKNENPFNFTVALPDEFSGYDNANQWEMAMVRCCIPNNIFTLPQGLYIEIMERFRGNIRGLPDSLNDRPINEVRAVLHDSREDFGTYYKKLSLDFDYNPTTDELGKLIVDSVEEMNGFEGLDEGQGPRTPYNDFRDMLHTYFIDGGFNENDNTFSFSSNRRMVFVMPYFVAIILGFENQVRMIGDDECYVEFLDKEPPGTPQLREAFAAPPVEKDVFEERLRYTLTSSEAMDINQYKPQNLLIECDCLTPAIVGNAYGQYLSYLPLNDISNAFTEFSPLHPEYHNINTNVLNRVNFRLAQIDGQIPRLLYPEAYNSTYFTLSFRRRRKENETYSSY